MKKRIITLIALLLVSCMALSGCSGDGIKENSTETINEETVTETVAPTDTNIGSAIDSLFSEKYELDVNGETITLDVGNHSEYFKKNNIFRYSDLAKDCGWHIPSEKYENARINLVYIFEKEDGETVYVYLFTNGEYISNIYFGSVESIEPWKEKNQHYFTFNVNSLENDEPVYLDSAGFFLTNNDGIAIISYLFRMLPQLSVEELFDGLFSRSDNLEILMGY